MYKPGDNYLICDQTGLKIRASQAKKRWDGAIVIADQCEPRHPQEFVKGIKERIAAKVSRPEQTDDFIGTNEVTAESL